MLRNQVKNRARNISAERSFLPRCCESGEERFVDHGIAMRFGDGSTDAASGGYPRGSITRIDRASPGELALCPIATLCATPQLAAPNSPREMPLAGCGLVGRCTSVMPGIVGNPPLGCVRPRRRCSSMSAGVAQFVGTGGIG